MLIYRGEIRFDLKGADPVKLPLLIRNYNQIIFRVDCRQAKNTWKVAGQLSQLVFLPGVGRIFTDSVPIRFSENMVIDLKKYPLSQLVFSPVKWLNRRTILSIYKPMALYPLSANSQAVTSTGKNTTVNVLATATALVVADPSRISMNIQNLGNKLIFVGFSNAVSSTNFAFSIPANTGYEFPTPFTGALWAISSSGTQAVNVVEMS